MISEFLLPVVAYVITLLVLWATVAIAKAISTRLSMPNLGMRQTARPMMVGTRTR